MKFSLWPRNDRAPADLLLQVRAAEDAGWHGVWFADHYMPNTSDATPARGDTYECWALLPALAAVTRRVRIGTLVSPTSVHHPALLIGSALIALSVITDLHIAHQVTMYLRDLGRIG